MPTAEHFAATLEFAAKKPYQSMRFWIEIFQNSVILCVWDMFIDSNQAQIVITPILNYKVNIITNVILFRLSHPFHHVKTQLNLDSLDIGHQAPRLNAGSAQEIQQNALFDIKLILNQDLSLHSFTGFNCERFPFLVLTEIKLWTRS